MLTEAGYRGDMEAALAAILEGKALGTFTKDDPDREFGTDRLGLHPHHKDLRQSASTVAIRQFQDIQTRLRNRLHQLAANYFDSEGDRTDHPDTPASRTALQTEMKRALKDSYIQSFRVGLHSTGLKKVTGGPEAELTKTERAWVESAYQQEMGYFTRFFKELMKGQARGNVYDRLDNYCLTLRSIYEAGKVRGSPLDSVIAWVLHPAEHCEDCKLLARFSPYTKLTLPTTPKAGSTRCLMNCKCTVNVRKASPEEVERVAARNLKASTLLQKLRQQRAR